MPVAATPTEALALFVFAAESFTKRTMNEIEPEDGPPQRSLGLKSRLSPANRIA